MRLLFLLTESPCPPDNGTRIVSYNILRLMCAAGHQCAIAIIGTTSAEDKIALTTFCQQQRIEWLDEFPLPKHNSGLIAFTSVLTFTPYFINKFYSSLLDTALEKLIDRWQPDSVHFDTICLTDFCKHLPAQIKKIASINDSYTLTLYNEIKNSHLSLLRKVYKYYQYFIVRRFERIAYNRFNAIHVVSKLDATTLEEIGVKSTLAVIPNGVSHLIEPQEIANNPPHIIFVAKLAGENLSAIQQFITHAWPSIKINNPGTILRIVGRTTPGSQRLERQLSDPHIEFTGFVADLTDIYQLGKIALVPINKNCGIINKAIEAMAAGLAVVGFDSCFTALSEANAGEHYLAGNTFSDLAEQINFLLKNPQEAERIGRSAQQLAENYYSWSSRADAFLSLYSPSNMVVAP